MADWFRSWHGAPTDPKWRTIAKRAKVSPSLVVAVAWALMDRASQGTVRGSIDGFDIETLADFMDCDVEEIDRIITAMREKCVLTDGIFTAWEKRQPLREDGSAERARLWREQKKLEQEEAERQKTTDPVEKRERTQANAKKHREDTETDTDKNAAAAARDDGFQKQLEDDCRRLVGQEPVLLAQDFHAVSKLLDDGLSEDDIRTGIAEAMARADSNYRFRAWRNFEKWIRTAAKNRLAGKPRAVPALGPAKPPDDPDDPRIEFGGGWSSPLSRAVKAHREGTWDIDHWGPSVGDPGCRVRERFWPAFGVQVERETGNVAA